MEWFGGQEESSDCYLDFSRAINTAYHSILTDKLMKWGLVKWTQGWADNRPPCWA